jgi:3-phenylpropionate/trans-cinnamate dioxygenase ferredoxin reductase subunit
VTCRSRSDELVIRGSLDEARFRAYWVAPDDTITAGMHVNDWEAIDSIRALVGEPASAIAPGSIR